MSELQPDELLVLRQYQLAKERQHGDLEVSIKDGKLVKLWTVTKVDLTPLRKAHLQEVP